MPYIKEERRTHLIKHNGLGLDIKTREITSPGELNFVITSVINDYLEGAALNYTAINDAIGVLECAKLELYRRVAAAYENKKIEQNGDVYKERMTK
jgi:hypothetical protein